MIKIVDTDLLARWFQEEAVGTDDHYRVNNDECKKEGF